MSAPTQITPEALLSHSDWVRRLVARLVYEPGQAEDVLQETWLIAMQRAPQNLADPRAWLARVATNVSRNLGRGEARRRRREAAVARLEALPDTVDVIAKAHLQGRMVECVLALAEPYRTPILLRFFEDLSPGQIAVRLGRPVNTVRSQIARGLAQLRGQLDSEFGDREAWGMAFLPLVGALKAPLAGGSQLANIGVGIMAMKWIAALVVVAVGWFFWDQQTNRNPEPIGLKPASEHRGLSLDRGPSNTPLAEQANSAGRIGVSTSPVEGLEPTVEITLVDPTTGRPMAGIPWWIMRTGSFDTGHGWNEKSEVSILSQGTTGPDGIVRLARPEDALVHLCTERTGRFARGSWPLGIERSKPNRKRLELPLGTTILGRIVDGEGRPEVGVEIRSRHFSGVHQTVAISDGAGEFRATHMANFPRAFVFESDGFVVATRTDNASFSLFKPGVTSVRFAWRGFSDRLPESTGPDSVYDAGEFVVEQGYMMTGIVVDGDGLPVVGALVSPSRVHTVDGNQSKQALPLPWQEGGAVSPDECLTGEDGRFSLEIRRDTHSFEKLAFFAQGWSPTAAYIPKQQPDGTRGSMHVTLELSHSHILHLVDREAPDHRLWHFNKQHARLHIRPDLPETAWGGRAKELTIPVNGELLITRSILQTDRAWATLIVDGYEPAQAELDLSQPGTTVELVRQPRIEVTVDLNGPGASKTERVDIMVCALPPLDATEAATSSVNGEAGSRSMIMDYGQFDHSLNGAPADGVSVFPWPMAQQTWVYIRPTARTGYEPMEISAFGPFQRDEVSVTCNLEVPGWVVTGSIEGEGEGAGLADKRGSHIFARVVSATTGDPIQDAEFLRMIVGKHRGVAESEADGTLEASIGRDEEDCRISHPLYHPVFLSPLKVRHGEAIELGEIALEPLNQVHGQLLDLAGNPLAEDRSINWQDPELGERWVRCEDDGSFILGVSGSPPAWVFVSDPDSPRRIKSKVDLVPSPADMEAEADNPMVCRIPPGAAVTVEIVGLDANVLSIFAPMILVGPDGAQAKLYHSMTRGGKALFDLSLPPGTYTMVSGWVISIPPTTIEVAPGVHTEPIIVTIQGQPRVR